MEQWDLELGMGGRNKNFVPQYNYFIFLLGATAYFVSHSLRLSASVWIQQHYELEEIENSYWRVKTFSKLLLRKLINTGLNQAKEGFAYQYWRSACSRRLREIIKREKDIIWIPLFHVVWKSDWDKQNDKLLTSHRQLLNCKIIFQVLNQSLLFMHVCVWKLNFKFKQKANVFCAKHSTKWRKCKKVSGMATEKLWYDVSVKWQIYIAQGR